MDGFIVIDPNIQEAITVYLESLKAHNEPIPPPIDEEVAEVAL
jgi:predicted RNase H-like HicB family nuclease